jgi:predicted  nucleic acid-binding Zn-ribbon protein
MAMTAVTDTDLKEIKDLIAALSGQMTTLQKEIADLRVSVGKIEATLQAQQQSVQKIPDLAEKVGELKNWRQIALTLGGALFGGAVTWLIRSSLSNP